MEHGFLSLAINPYHPSLIVGLLGCILCPLWADVKGAYDKFPDFFRVGTFIDSTYMKL